MSQAMESYAVWLADFYLLTTVLLGLAMAPCAVLKQPAQRLALAKSAFLGLMLLSVLSAIPGWSAIHLLTARDPPALLPVVEREAPVVRPSLPPVEVNPPMTTAQRPSIASTPTMLPNEKSSTPIQWAMVLCTLHACGAVIVAVWLFVGWFASRRLRRSARPAPPWLRSLLNEVSSSRTQESAELHTSERIDVAVALGVWRPAILLPSRWCDELSPNPALRGTGKLRTVLAHEAAHLASGDLRWVALMRVLLIALWAHPLFWFMRRRLRLDQEALADAAAAEVAGRQAYAEQLVAWAREGSRRTAIQLSSAVGLWEGPSQLRQRIDLLLNEKFTVLRQCTRRWRFAVAMLAMCAAIGLSIVTIQPGETASPSDSKIDSSFASKPSATGALTVRFEYHGTPPEPKEHKEWIWRAKLDNRELGRFNIEKEVGAKVFDESLVIGKDRGIANIFVWVHEKGTNMASVESSVRRRWDEKQWRWVPIEYKGPPVPVSYQKGRYDPHALAFEWPRRLIFRNADPKSACNFHYEGQQAGYNIGLKAGEERIVDVGPERFPVRLSGNVEPWLRGWVFPCSNQFFAVSDTDGKIQIADLPPGKWEFQVWHERGGYLKIERWPRGRFTIDIKPGENVDLGTVKISPAVFEERETAKADSTPSASVSQSSVVEGHTIQLDAPVVELKELVNLATGSVDVAPIEKSHSKPQTQAKTENPAIAEDKSDVLGAIFQTATPPGVPNAIAGQCVDETPLAGVDVLLARATWDGTSRKVISRQTTAADGRFRFEHVVDIKREYPNGRIPKFPNPAIPTFQISARKAGRESCSVLLDQSQIANYEAKIALRMGQGATLRGRVTNPNGELVGGALVSVGWSQLDRWEGFQTVRTRADGTYEITDAPTLKPADEKRGSADELPSGTYSVVSRAGNQPIFVTQTDYADRIVLCKGIPGTQDIQLKPAAIIEGRAIDRATSKPAANTRVLAMPTIMKGAEDANFAFVTTDDDGGYRIRSLPEGTYNLWAIAPERVNEGVNNLKTSSDRETNAPVLALKQGGKLRIRLIDDKPGKPIPLGGDENATIQVDPSAPFTGGEYVTAKDGRFEVRVIPGDVTIGSVAATSIGEITWLTRAGEKVAAHAEDGKATDVDVRVQKIEEDLNKRMAAMFDRAVAARHAGDDRKARAAYDEIIAIDPPFPNNVAAYFVQSRLLATSADETVRNGKRAVELAQKAIKLQGQPTADLLDALAAGYAEVGDFDKAIDAQKKAISLASKDKRGDRYRDPLKLYESHKPRRERAKVRGTSSVPPIES